MAALSSGDAPAGDQGPGTRQFLREVFPAELDEIRRRRGRAADTRELPDSAPGEPPSTRLGLVGLAFSGGGIRSSSFSLGVTQHLLKTGLFYRADYLSTVSGGGYTGSCLSTLMSDGRGGERLLVETRGAGEPPALNHLRNNSNYLAPEGLLNRLRMPALMITGAAYTLLLIVPLVILAVFLTELLFEATGPLGLNLFRPFGLSVPRAAIPLLGLLPLLLALFIRPIWAFVRGNRFDWARRDQRDRRLGGYLLLAIASLVAVPVLHGLEQIVDASVASLRSALSAEIEAQLAAGWRGWLVWAVGALTVAVVYGLARARRRLLIVTFAILGPLLISGLYAILCAYAINSPFVGRCLADDDRPECRLEALGRPDDLAEGRPAGATPGRSAALRMALTPILEKKNLQEALYDVCWGRYATTGDGGPWFRSMRATSVVLRRRDVTWLKDGRVEADACAADEPIWEARLGSYLGTTWIPHLTLETAHTKHGDERVISIPELSLLLRGRTEWWIYLAGLLILLFNRSFIDVNRISFHPFYRDRLSRTFLIRAEDGELRSADTMRLHELASADSAAPYHLVNTALNLQGSRDPQLRQRKTVPFVFAKRFCGGDYCGYAPTENLESLDRHIDLGTAMAISAAAAAPNTGAKSVGPVSLLLALLNFRLNYWLPHPKNATGKAQFRLASRTPGVPELLREGFEAADDPSSDRTREGKPPRFINCSDGGHLENLAVIELLRRRCSVIVCLDAESDPGFDFKGLVTLQRYAEIDFNASIDIDIDAIRADADGISKSHFAIGTITYGGGEHGQKDETGTFIYLKLSVTGDEPEYLRFYRKATPRFPHESTGDQFFDETKFEVYRALGEHVAQAAFATPEAVGLFKPGGR